ncbi:MAG: hypothetical protein HY744_31525 [Deltaproteobacteria bacterium]|nr:hypothetical protein [Deltaproteobacteria bacterium]
MSCSVPALRRSLAELAAWLVLLLGCGPEPGTTPTVPNSPPDGVGGGLPDAGPADAGDGGPVDAEPPADAASSPVWLGVTPNARQEGDAPATAADELEAELTVRAAGVRAFVLFERWNELEDKGLEPLAGRVAGLRESGLHVGLCLMVVDGSKAYRPAAVQDLDWDASETASALGVLTGKIVEAMGGEIEALILGRAADRYLEAHPGESHALRALLEKAVAGATELAPASLRVGVGLSFTPAPPQDYVALASLGTVTALGYLPGLGEEPVSAQVQVAKDLDAMIALAGARPIDLVGAGFTSSAGLGSSPELQEQTLAGLFAALAPRSPSFRMVNVYALHDRAGAGCDAFAAGRGYGPDEPAARYLCEAGLRAVDGAAKPAWLALLAAAAAFASP